jgi:hypothetical protein
MAGHRGLPTVSDREILFSVRRGVKWKAKIHNHFTNVDEVEGHALNSSNTRAIPWRKFCGGVIRLTIRYPSLGKS